MNRVSEDKNMINLVDDIIPVKKKSKGEKPLNGKGKASIFLSKDEQSALERDLQVMIIIRLYNYVIRTKKITNSKKKSNS
jgi:hypothetical protein